MSASKVRAVSDDTVRQQVRTRYGGIASGGGCGTSEGQSLSCCGGDAGSSCCGQSTPATQLGYSAADLATLPEGANLGLGCGNPTAILALQPRQVVLDLGSGGGIDCFLAAKRVGTKGHVIGVDMTPEMVARARANGLKGRYPNVEFRLGEIEHLPVADGTVDVVISNCVINLVPDKGQVYRESFRVLRPGGRLAISDVVATRPIRAKDRANLTLWSSCSSGALEVREVKFLLRRAGFKGVRVDLKVPNEVPPSLKGQASLGVISADITATKPAG
ncbi:MAG TPA: arsenite methyltransferase [Thermoplasmata archaeon]|jgi:SAM-dependent methyltransferase|nr:arsenite methyltransferase [Thermoplasmata archaeon]